jgi:hypothetical protein
LRPIVSLRGDISLSEYYASSVKESQAHL